MKLFETTYNIEPRFLNKMLKEFKRRGLMWTQKEWIDGEMSGVVSGSQDAVVDFVISSQRRMNPKTGRWRKITRKEALKDVNPSQEEEVFDEDPNPYPWWHPGH